MKSPQKKDSANLNISSCPTQGSHHFSHEAMNTVFEIFIFSDDPDYAASAAVTAFKKLDYLESELSKFIENSDISRINNLPANQPLVVSLETFQALCICKSVYHQTNGAFDISIGPLMNCWLNQDKSLKKPTPARLKRAKKAVGLSNLELNPDDFTVTKKNADLKLDLGGFGKGFALDKMAEVLAEWKIKSAFLNSGSSTVLALKSLPHHTGWPVSISDPSNTSRTIAMINVKDFALSGSGIEYGYHIIDPRSAKPVKSRLCAWSSAKTAGIADALSTAFMVMSPAEIKKYCSTHRDTLAMIADKLPKIKTPRIKHFGSWKKDELLIKMR